MRMKMEWPRKRALPFYNANPANMLAPPSSTRDVPYGLSDVSERFQPSIEPMKCLTKSTKLPRGLDPWRGSREQMSEA